MELSIINIESISKFKTFQHIYTDFIFPCAKFVTKSYRCNRIWLKNRTWLTYSPSKDTLFWLSCLLFGNVKKLNLASTSLKYWVLALSPKLGDHRNKQYKEAVEKCHDLVKTMKDLLWALMRKWTVWKPGKSRKTEVEFEFWWNV